MGDWLDPHVLLRRHQVDISERLLLRVAPERVLHRRALLTYQQGGPPENRRPLLQVLSL